MENDKKEQKKLGFLRLLKPFTLINGIIGIQFSDSEFRAFLFWLTISIPLLEYTLDCIIEFLKEREIEVTE